MTRHRRPGLLARVLRHQPTVAVPALRPSIELVDGRTHVAHRVTTDELAELSKIGGTCRALCGMRVFAASLADPGKRCCRICTS